MADIFLEVMKSELVEIYNLFNNLVESVLLVVFDNQYVCSSGKMWIFELGYPLDTV